MKSIMRHSRQPNLARSVTKRKQSVHEARFIPAFSVRMHVSPEDGMASATYHALIRNLKTAKKNRDIPRELADACRVIRPEDMYLSIIKRGMLVQAVRQGKEETGKQVSSRNVIMLATDVYQSLNRKHEADYEKAVFKPGKVDDFGSVLGMAPQGWRGPNARYPEKDRSGKPNLPNIVLNDKRICLEGIQAKRKKVPTTLTLADEVLGQTPYIGLIRKMGGGGFADHEVRQLRPIVEDATRDDLIMQQSVVFLRTSPGSKNPRELAVKSVSEIDYAEAVPGLIEPDIFVPDPSEVEVDFGYMDRMSA